MQPFVGGRWVFGICLVALHQRLSTAAIKFPPQLETAWLLSSFLGFSLDVMVYHTFSLLVRSVMELLVGATDCHALDAHVWCLWAPHWHDRHVSPAVLPHTAPQVTVSMGTNRSTLASGLARGAEMGACRAFAGAVSL
jgi:hypothetical protein